MDVQSRTDNLRKLAQRSLREGKRVYGVAEVGGELIQVWIVGGCIEVAVSERSEQWNWPIGVSPINVRNDPEEV